MSAACEREFFLVSTPPVVLAFDYDYHKRGLQQLLPSVRVYS